MERPGEGSTQGASPNGSTSATTQSTAVSKRGARACANCRKGKNRCIPSEIEGQPCKRCASNGAPCVFETPTGKGVEEERIDKLERDVAALQRTVDVLSRRNVSYEFGGSAPNTGGINMYPIPQPHPGPLPSHMTQPLRLDADFNARSPSNPLHWDTMDTVPSSLTPLLSHQPLSHPHHYPSRPHNALQPPTIPPAPASITSPPQKFSPDSSSSGTVTGPAGSSHAGPFGHQSAAVPAGGTENSFGTSRAGELPPPTKRARLSPAAIAGPGPGSGSGTATATRKRYPELPGFRAPPHPISQYGLVPSAAPSDDDEDETLPSASLTAPFEALAEAAAAASGEINPSHQGQSGTATPVHNRGRQRKRSRRRRMPPPPNAFPDVVEKGLVTDEIGRQVFKFYFTHCHRFFPIFNPMTDDYDSMRSRTPWSINSIICIAASRMPNSSPELLQAADHALEEANGIARSSLFGPTVRPEGVQAMAILAAFGENGYLATGHALRMAFELALHRALEKLESWAGGAEPSKVRREDEQRDLLASARTFLALWSLDYHLSIGSNRPWKGDEDLVSLEKLAAMLRHPLSTDSDILLVAEVELIICRSRIDSNLKGTGMTSDSRMAEFARRSGRDLQLWWQKWDQNLSARFDEESFERKSLTCSLHAANIFLATTSLKHHNIGDTEHLSADARELAISARKSAHDFIDIWLNSPAYCETRRFSPPSAYVDVAFAALLSLKLAKLFPDGVSLSQVMQQCQQLHSVLRGIPDANRFALTLWIALERFSKAFGLEVDLAAQVEQQTAFGSGNGFMVPFSGDNHGSNPNSNNLANSFDLSALPFSSDPGWVGSDTYPAWLSDESNWTFDNMDMSQGLDRLFLPLWSTQINDGASDW